MGLSPGYIALVAAAKQIVREIDIAKYREMKASGEPFRLVDVREDDEFRAGHAAGAIHLGKGIIERDIEKTIPDKDETLVLYCGGGFRSALAGEAIQKMGYKNVISLDGGWKAWNEAGLPTEK